MGLAKPEEGAKGVIFVEACLEALQDWHFMQRIVLWSSAFVVCRLRRVCRAGSQAA